ncbi:MAG: AAA family ATPase, partial [Ferrimicrobium sp.]
MGGQTFSHCKKITDVNAILVHVFSEEEKQLTRVAGSVKVGELAEILGGQARNPQWVGAGWEGVPADANDPQAVTLALGVSARKQTRVQAYSCIMDTPKGMSLVVASDPKLREWFNTECRPKMAAAYMEALEAETVLQGWKEGERDFPPVTGLRGWWAGHSISGAGDPHLHNHLVISATATAEDGRVGQIDGASFLRRTVKIADAASKRVMMEEAAKVGLKFGPGGDLCGIDADLIEGASNAHGAVAAIKTYFASEGTPISDEQAWKHWRQIAAGKAAKGLPASLVEQIRKSRGEGMTLSAEALEHSLDAALGDTEKAEVVGRWLAGKYNLTEAEWNGLADRARAAAEVEPDYDDVDRVLGLIATLKTAPKVVEVEALCARLADADGRADLMERVGQDPRILVGSKHWVLKENHYREIALRERVEKLLAEGHQGREIADALADLESPLVVVSGVAGAGKSTHLLEAKDAWAAAEVRVWAAARNTLTATETGKAAGAKQSLSLAALRQRIARGSKNVPQAGDVMVIDEFGLIDSAQVSMLLDLAEGGVKVKVLGDSHQIQPIDQSPDARVVMDLAAKYGAGELAKSYRTEKWSDLHARLRASVTGGRPAQWALGWMDIREASTAQEIVDIAIEAGGQIAVQTNALRVHIAEALPRPEMPMDAKGEPVVAMLRDGIAGWTGDQVIVRKNVWVSVGDLNQLAASTGQTGLLMSVGAKTVEVIVDGRTVTLSKREARESLALGGVQTGDSAQGQTWDRAVVVLTGIESREWLYSTATRGLEAPIFVVMRGDEDDDSGDARSLVKSVLTRSGMAQTTEELALGDAKLAASITESETGGSGWMPPEGREAEATDGDEVTPGRVGSTHGYDPPSEPVAEPVVPAPNGRIHGYDPLSEPEPEVVREPELTATSELPGLLSEGELTEATAAVERALAAYADAVAEGAGVRTLTRLQDAAVAASSQAEDAREMRESLIEFLSDEERIEVDA